MIFAKSTKIMIETPITELSRYIASKWYLSTEQLSAKSGVPLRVIKRALQGERIPQKYEKPLREFLDKL